MIVDVLSALHWAVVAVGLVVEAMGPQPAPRLADCRPVDPVTYEILSEECPADEPTR